MTEIEPDAYELRGITAEGREVILSYEEDDAGNIDMRIRGREPLYTTDTILIAIENLRDKGIDAQGNCENIARDRALRELKEVFSE